MSTGRLEKSHDPPTSNRFHTTHWSVVLAAGNRRSPDSQRALAALCQSYWYPLYAFLRRQGQQPAEAQDLTQAFFARLLEKQYLRAADQQRGRFRTFLLTVFKRFLANQHQYATAQKRGGGQVVLSFEFDSGEQRLQLEPSHECTPERVFERRWALTLLDRVLEELSQEYARRGKAELFSALQGVLQGDDLGSGYDELGAGLGMTAGAVKVAVYRLRTRYRELLRQEICSTVADEDEVDDELQYLLAALSNCDVEQPRGLYVC